MLARPAAHATRTRGVLSISDQVCPGAAAQTVARARCLQVLVLVGKRHVLRGRQLRLVLRDCVLVDDDLRRLEGRRLDEDQVGVAARSGEG